MGEAAEYLNVQKNAHDGAWKLRLVNLVLANARKFLFVKLAKFVDGFLAMIFQRVASIFLSLEWHTNIGMFVNACEHFQTMLPSRCLIQSANFPAVLQILSFPLGANAIIEQILIPLFKFSHGLNWL